MTFNHKRALKYFIITIIILALLAYGIQALLCRGLDEMQCNEVIFPALNGSLFLAVLIVILSYFVSGHWDD